jgi:hypothetical protein
LIAHGRLTADQSWSVLERPARAYGGFIDMTTLVNGRSRAARRLRWRLLAAGALIPLAAACGGGNSNDVASLAGGPTTTANKSKAASTDPADASLDFARCMRENGVTAFPDPQSGEAGTFGFRIGADASTANAINPSDPVFQAAQEKCFPILEAAIPEDTQQIDPDLEDKFNQMTKCMRDAGYDVGDAIVVRAGGGKGPVTNSVSRDAPPAAPSFDPSDPKFQETQKDCAAKAGINPPSGSSSGSGLTITGGAK